MSSTDNIRAAGGSESSDAALETVLPSFQSAKELINWMSDKDHLSLLEKFSKSQIEDFLKQKGVTDIRVLRERAYSIFEEAKAGGGDFELRNCGFYENKRFAFVCDKKPIFLTLGPAFYDLRENIPYAKLEKDKTGDWIAVKHYKCDFRERTDLGWAYVLGEHHHAVNPNNFKAPHYASEQYSQFPESPDYAPWLDAAYPPQAESGFINAIRAKLSRLWHGN